MIKYNPFKTKTINMCVYYVSPETVSDDEAPVLDHWGM